MKKVLLGAAALALVSTAASAQSYPAFGQNYLNKWATTQGDFSGPYIGAEGVYTDREVDGWGGGVVGGLGWTPDIPGWQHLYLGAEAGYDWTGAENNGLAEHNKANFSIRPGFTAGPALIYAIGNYSRTNFKDNATDDNKWLSGLGGGGGLQTSLPYTPFKVRAEYIYTDYQDSSITNGHTHDNDIKAALVYQLPVKQMGGW